jgi:uncharacterized membrane protein
MRAGILALMVVLVALLLLPFLLADAMIGGLLALGLSPRIALLLVIGIFLGSMFNVPVWRRTTGARVIEYQQQALFGIERLVPRVLHADAQQVVALNVGGCILPVLIVGYELVRLFARADSAAIALALAVIAVNIGVCHRLARPVAGLGILLPALVPGCLAALLAHAPCARTRAGGRVLRRGARSAGRRRRAAPARPRPPRGRHAQHRRSGHLRRHRDLGLPGTVAERLTIRSLLTSCALPHTSTGAPLMDLEDFRREYLAPGLHRKDLDPSPFVQFETWLRHAIDAGLRDPTAMALATVDQRGWPSQRLVLLKHCDASGFVFYTNLESRKACEIAANARVALLFPWSGHGAPGTHRRSCRAHG